MTTIAENIARIQQAKADIKSAIEAKGVEVGDGLINTYADKVAEISGGGGNLQTKDVTITSNGTSSVRPDTGYSGLSKVNLTTNVQPNLETKSITITSNTTTTIAPTQGKDGLSQVQVTTNVSGGSSYNWEDIGFTYEPKVNEYIYNNGKEIYDNWDTSITNADNMFKSSRGNNMIVTFPNVDTSNITSMANMFYQNYSLVEINDNFSFENCTNTGNMFSSCCNLRYVGNVMPPVGCTMGGMFTECYNLRNINNLRIGNSSNNMNVLRNITDLTINKLYLSLNRISMGSTIVNCTNLNIKEIVNENNLPSLEYAFFSGCTFTDKSIDEILKYFKTLTNQATKYKTLKALGFTSANCDQAILSSEWQDLVDAGWTTGY